MKVIQKMVNKIYYIILIYIAFTTNKISIDLEQNKKENTITENNLNKANNEINELNEEIIKLKNKINENEKLIEQNESINTEINELKINKDIFI